MTDLKRYLVFAGNQYYSAGGWGDFKFSVDSLDDIKPEIIKRNLQVKEPYHEDAFGDCDWIQVIDTHDIDGDRVLPREREQGLIRIAAVSYKKRVGTLEDDEEVSERDFDLYAMDEYIKIEPPKPRGYTCMICEKVVTGSHDCSHSYKNGEEVEC